MKLKEIIPFMRWHCFKQDWVRRGKILRHPISAYQVKREMWEIRQGRKDWFRG